MSLNPRKHEAFDPARDLQCDDSFRVPPWLGACGLLAAVSQRVTDAGPSAEHETYRIAAKTSSGRPLRGGFARIEGIYGPDIFCAGNENGELYFFELRGDTPVVSGRITLSGTIFSRPLFHEGLLFCVTGEGMLYAIRTNPGAEGGPLRNSIEWQKKMKKGIMTAPAALPGVVLVAPLDGLYGLASGSGPGKAAGTVLWGASISGTMSTPCVYENTILIGTEDRRLMAFDSGSGRLAGKWECELGAPCRTTPAVAPAAALASAVTIDGTLFCADAEHGKIRWSFRSDSPAPGGVAAGAVPGGECFLFGTEKGNFYCIDTNGRKSWEYIAGGSIRIEPLIHEGMVFFGAGENRLVCLEVSSGRQVSVLRIEGEVSAKPVVAGNSLVFGTTAGYICVAVPG
ncbi:MAG TPA: PQQ-binding-like beta-propeller repeat protein [Spirochaetota bacterium]|nr:PQQ-binding-like beta-propeller repeat protein [Spirochaetota bacterium]